MGRDGFILGLVALEVDEADVEVWRRTSLFSWFICPVISDRLPVYFSA